MCVCVCVYINVIKNFAIYIVNKNDIINKNYFGIYTTVHVLKVAFLKFGFKSFIPYLKVNQTRSYIFAVF